MHSEESQSGASDSQRSNINVEDLPCIPEVTPQDFLDFVIPAVPPANLENILNLLQDDAITDGRIRGFDKEPKEAGLTEDKQFRHLHNFSERVLAIASNELGATETLVSRYTPHETPRSEKRNGSRPDKSLVRKGAPQPSEGRVGWQDIVLAFEFKLDDKDKDLYDIRRKTLWNPHHILRNDPRRLFTFGISIENTSCRFWYFSRSHVMVSQSFNFITNYEPYVQILVGLAFAHVFDRETPAVAELPLRLHGYDPTVQRLDDSGNYSIRVGDKTYITCGVLSDFRAESICGRCTRVWKVYKEGDRNTFYVLKDVWVDRRNKTEGEIWKQLKKDMSVQQLRPTISPISSRNSSRSGIAGTPGDYVAYQLNCQCYRDHPVYIPRRHDRTVWKEVCTTYENLTDLPKMIVSLQHAIIALHAMWKGSKAIHRDLSSGNIFYDDKTGSGRLGDLEFVTFYTDDAVPQENNRSLSIKVGTPQFMACEVFAGHYLMQPDSLPTTLDEGSRDLSDLPSTEVYFNDVDEPPTFLHNPLHDLESVWWLLVWTLLRFHPESTLPPDRDALRHQLEVFLTLFPGTQAQRRDAFQSFTLDHTSPKVSLIGTAHISKHVASLSKELVATYKAVEKSFPIPAAAFKGAHKRALEVLRLIDRKVAKISVGKLIPVQVTLAELLEGEMKVDGIKKNVTS